MPKNIKYSIKEVEKILLKNNKILLDDEYINIHTPIKIKCIICEHIFKMRLSDAKKQNCPKCAIENRKNKLKLSITKVKSVIENKNGLLLSENYVNARTKIKVKCLKCDYIWNITFDKIHQGRWCPKCSGNAIYTIKEVKNKIQGLGGTLNTEKYINGKQLLNITCYMGHNWFAKFNNIMAGSWCPECASSKTQKLLYEIISNLFGKDNVYYNYKEFEWLKNHKTKRKLELDIFVKNVKLAIEYDGEQHFMPRNFGGISKNKARKEFEIRKHLDKLKNSLIKKYQDDIKYFIRFNYKDKIDEICVRKKLEEYNLYV